MATASSPMTIRAKPDEREAFELICDSIGTTSANAVRMFVSAFNKQGVFPFDPSNPYGFSTETLQTMDDAAHGRNPIGPVDGVEAMRKPWILTGSSAACRSGSRPGSRRTTRNAKQLLDGSLWTGMPTGGAPLAACRTARRRSAHS